MNALVEFTKDAKVELGFDSIIKVFDAQGFIKLYETRKCDIEDVAYLPPVLGSNSFGRYKVTFTNEQFQSEQEQW